LKDEKGDENKNRDTRLKTTQKKYTVEEER